jgi:hypothetical protein
LRAGIPLSTTARLPSFLAGPHRGSLAASGWCYTALRPWLAAIACGLCCASLGAQPFWSRWTQQKAGVSAVCVMIAAGGCDAQLHRALGPVPSTCRPGEQVKMSESQHIRFVRKQLASARWRQRCGALIPGDAGGVAHSAGGVRACAQGPGSLLKRPSGRFHFRCSIHGQHSLLLISRAAPAVCSFHGQPHFAAHVTGSPTESGVQPLLTRRRCPSTGGQANRKMAQPDAVLPHSCCAVVQQSPCT